MMVLSKKHRARLVARTMAIGMALSAQGCIGMSEAMHPLPLEAERVALVPSGQEWSVELAESCRRVGRLEHVRSEHFARLRAAEHEVDVVQVLSALQSNGHTYRLNVRFWDCAGAMDHRLAGG